jgi:hypothetical protein
MIHVGPAAYGGAEGRSGGVAALRWEVTLAAVTVTADSLAGKEVAE